MNPPPPPTPVPPPPPDLRIFYNPQLAAGEETLHCVVSLSLAGGEAGSGDSLAVALALDRSFSMNRVMPQARRATSLFVHGCGQEMVCAIVTFSDEATVAVEAGHCTADWKQKAQRRIGELDGKGGTRMSRALQACIQQLSRFHGRQRRILFVTDGRNAEEKSRLETVLGECQRQRITISAWGLGEDWDEDDLLSMARSTGGECGCVIDPSHLAQTFQASLRSLMLPRLSQVELELEPLHPDLCVREVVQAHPVLMPLHRTAPLTWALGDLESGTSVALRLALAVPRGLGPEVVELARPRLRFRRGQQTETMEGSVPLWCQVSGQAAPHPFVTHYLRQEEAVRQAEQGRKLWFSGEQVEATRCLQVARQLGGESVVAMIDNLALEKPNGSLFKSSVLNLYRTRPHAED